MIQIIKFMIILSFLVSCKNDQKHYLSQDYEWQMHHIDDSLYNHNSLSPGDVNQDGYDDYAVIHEGPDAYTIIFHPGEQGDTKQKWEKVIIAKGGNLEYAYLSDLDGDGNLDMVGVEGLKKAHQSGVRIFWGPDKQDVKNPEKWESAGFIPGTENLGHYLYVECHDINNDDAPDIITGGRILETNKSFGGIRWLKAPTIKDERRDLSKWKLYAIDPVQFSGHGFELVDINLDGNLDVVLANPDWNTSDKNEEVVWYEHPGQEAPELFEPWEKHIILKTQELFSKAQVAIGDINRDGMPDVCVQSDNRVFLSQQTKNSGQIEWNSLVIQKPEIARWVTRPIEMADLNNDGKLDIVCMMIHNYGYTPKGLASVYWMEFQGDIPGTDNWITHVIKWSDGMYSGRTWQGEKWDHCRFFDMDKDGDLDLIANCEEMYERKDEIKKTKIGVVWFENPRND